MKGQALIGYSGFVGSSLRRQAHFDALYRSDDIKQIEGRSFDSIFCAGAPAQKWLANQQPEQDQLTISHLQSCLAKVRCRCFILISTVDVFAQPEGVDETSPPSLTGLHPYGRHRLALEHFVQQHFEQHLIVRLAGLVGPGLRKNALYDLTHSNSQLIDPRSVFQFYPMVNLLYDINLALQHQLTLLHLTSAPLSIEHIVGSCFHAPPLLHPQAQPPVHYDFRTRHAALYQSEGFYQYSPREVLLAIRAYIQGEQATLGQQPQ